MLANISSTCLQRFSFILSLITDKVPSCCGLNMMMMNQNAICDSTLMPPNYHGMYNGFNPYNPVISSTGVFPAITDFAGDTNFQIILNENDSVKKKWLVSFPITCTCYQIPRCASLKSSLLAIPFCRVTFQASSPQ